jgi:hypothetical protein
VLFAVKNRFNPCITPPATEKSFPARTITIKPYGGLGFSLGFLLHKQHIKGSNISRGGSLPSTGRMKDARTVNLLRVNDHGLIIRAI